MDDLMAVFGHFLQRSQYSAGQVATLSGVPKRSLHNWLDGRVSKPHRWQTVLQVAAALQLSETETNRLLQAAKHVPVRELRRAATTADDLALLNTWPPAGHVPFQAVRKPPFFVGRLNAITAVTNALQKGQSIAICSLRGMGGVGKTALAAYLAYHLRPAFPDGVLWAQLDVSDTMSILAAFADAYKLDVSHYRDIETRAAAVRDLLSEKRALIILDNAENSAQVRPLLPSSTGKTAVILTTRRDLQVSDEMYKLLLPPFDVQAEEALQLFTSYLGEPTVRRFQPELRAIAELLEHLPLAIALTGGRLAADTTIPEYLAALRKASRLDPLTREDRSVRLSFDLSYGALLPDLQHFFSALGAFNGEDFGLEAAAYVTQQELPATVEKLNKLVDLSLVQAVRQDRYRLHTLLREYAAEKSATSFFQQRLVNYYINFLVRAADDTGLILSEVSNLHAALKTAENLELQQEYLQGVQQFAPFLHRAGLLPQGPPYLETALQFAEALNLKRDQGWLRIRQARSAIAIGQIDEAERLLQMARILGREIEDPGLLTHALTDLGSVAGGYRQDYQQALAYLEEAKYWADEANDRVALSKIFQYIANVAYEQGEWSKTEENFLRCLSIVEEEQGLFNGNAADILMNLGTLYMTKGELDKAKSYLLQSLEIAREIKYVICFCMSAATFTDVLIGLDRAVEAQPLLEEGLVMAEEANYPVALVRVLSRYGLVLANIGKFPEAIEQLERALQLARNHNQLWDELDALIQLGEVHLANKSPIEARRCYQQALQKMQSPQQPEITAFILYGLAQVSFQEGNAVEARRQGEESLALFDQIGHNTANLVRQWMQSFAAA